MRSITAAEIGPDICALTRTSIDDAGEIHLWAAEAIDPDAFRGVDALTRAVRRARRTMKLPRQCRAVVWGLPDGIRRGDPLVVPLIQPLTGAGFKVTRVVTPCNALGALARVHASRTGGVMCWVGVNRTGIAIVVVRPGKLLYAHSFAWDSNIGASGSQARLLQRYSHVACLAPEVRRALAAARQKGSTVDRIVTCGSLPDLKLLTTPLIEELDMEVETLDSLEGLIVTPDTADLLADLAPSLRIACAATVARETRSVDEAKRRRMRQHTRTSRVLRFALPAALILAAAAWYYFRPSKPVSGSRVPASSSQLPASRSQLPGSGTQPQVSSSEPRALPAEGGRDTKQETSAAPPTPAPKPDPAASQPAVPASNPQPLASVPSVLRPPSAAAGDRSSVPGPPASVPGPPSSAPRALEGKPSGALSSPARTADKPVTTPTDAAIPPTRGSSSAQQVSEARTPSGPGPMPGLLADPVPRVTAILVSTDRRLATIGDDGRIVGLGDTVGRRVVAGIDDRTVVLREPSGVRIRVALGGRIVGIERGDR